MKKLIALVSVGVIGAFNGLQAQDKYGATPEIQEKCKQNISLYREFRDQKNIDDAFEPWKKAVEICPKAAKTLYIDGVNFYEHKLKNATDAAVKQAMIDSMLAVYDMRIEHFGQKGYVLGLKGMDMFKYRDEKPFEAYQVLKEAVALTKGNTQPGVLDIYYRSMFESLKKEKLDRELLLTEYLVISEYLEEGRAGAKEKYYSFYDKSRDNINEFFILVAQCEDIEKLAAKKFA